MGYLIPIRYLAFTSFLIPSLQYPHVSLQFLIVISTGILTCCPSTTRFRLILGPDLPRADKLDSGNLGYSAFKILT